MSTRRTAPLGAALLSILLALAACSSGAESGGTGGSATGDVDPDKVYVEGVPTLTELMKGTIGEPPTTGPKGVPGKRVWYLSCNQLLPACAEMADSAKEAAEILGWDLSIGDGKSTATVYADVMSTAIAQKPDAILVGGVACANIKQPLEQARAAGIVVLGVKSPDCDEPPTNGEKLFTESMYYVGTNEHGYSAATELRSKDAASYLINITQGKAKVIFEKGNDPAIEPSNRAFLEQLAKCGGCKIVKTVDYVPTDQGPDGALAQGLQAALVQHPEANVLFAQYDANLILSRGAQIVKASGNDIAIVGADGSADGLDLVRNGQVAVETGAHSYEWWAYGAMDSLNRIFAGEPVIDQGLGYTPVDKDHNLPAKAGDVVAAPFDVKATYSDIWK